MGKCFERRPLRIGKSERTHFGISCRATAFKKLRGPIRALWASGVGKTSLGKSIAATGRDFVRMSLAEFAMKAKFVATEELISGRCQARSCNR